VASSTIGSMPMSRAAGTVSGRVLHLLWLALLVAAASLYVPLGGGTLILLAIAMSLVMVTVLVRVLAGRAAAAQSLVADGLATFVHNDSAPSFATTADGVITHRNPAAAARFGEADFPTLIRTLGDMVASPASVIHRLQSRAEVTGAASEDVVTRKGHVRIGVHSVGAEVFLWRLEDMVERSAGGRGAEGISLPMLTVSKSGTILFMNDTLRRLLGGRPKTLASMFSELPLRSGEIRALPTPDGPVSVRVIETSGACARREIFLAPVAGEVAVPSGGAEIFENLPVPLLRLAGDGRVLLANRLSRDMLKFAGDDGEVRLFDLVEGLGRSVQDWLKDAAEGRTLNHPEVVLATRSDHDLYLQITLGRVLEGKHASLLAVLNDATELKTLEAQFVQSQKMQAIGQLAGGVAHDFNNLLTAISGHCDLLLLRYDKGAPEYADLMQIAENANRAASLVGQLLAFSRKQNLQFVVLDLRDTLAELAHLLNRLVGEKVTLVQTHDPRLRAIRADKRQLEQVVMNLVVNARDAMPEGGEIRITTQNVSLAEELVRDRARVPVGDYVKVTVADEGTGILPDNLAKIFEPFFTTKRIGEGTGLGLSTAYGIVKQTGGFIFADSVLGAGTVFTLYLPASDGRADAVVAPPARAESVARHGDGVVLLVEDEAPVRAFASRALKMRGYTVLEADSGEAALDILQREEVRVDLFVTDVIMPGMDGPTWVREARLIRPATKVVFMSGYAEGAFSDQQAEIPGSVFLPKPFSLIQLATAVQSQLGG